MEPIHRETRRSRHQDDWRNARGLVIEGHVVSGGATGGRPSFTSPSMPRWGAALDAAARLGAPTPGLTLLALPAGVALAALAVFTLLPGEPPRHGATEPSVRVAAAPQVIR
ncbi:hypothetical protein [uncultured Aureimonas sp.]|uniref:hypothetical protein n=1 Tax=uncultured Aureimonas sp. TaxID=1604662 RepID=UPI0025E8BDFF|nr:hypothetical protein [uncultured Aureimonas sp.]